MTWARTRALAAAAAATAALALGASACGGDGGSGEGPIPSTGATEADQEVAATIADELQGPTFTGDVDLEAMPDTVGIRVTAILEALRQVPKKTTGIAVADGAATAETTLGDSETDIASAKLICGVLIENTDGPAGGNTVLGGSGEIVRQCEPADRNYP